MSYWLDVSQLAEALERAGLQDQVRILESAVDGVAAVLAANTKTCITSAASNQPGFGGLMVAFGPSFEGQEIPAALEGFDQAEEWR